jgi:hypothetical protein
MLHARRLARCLWHVVAKGGYGRVAHRQHIGAVSQRLLDGIDVTVRGAAASSSFTKSIV